MTEVKVKFSEGSTGLLTDKNHNRFGFELSPPPNDNFRRVFDDVRTKTPHQELEKADFNFNGGTLKVTVPTSITRKTVQNAAEDLVAKTNAEIKEFLEN